LDGDLLLRGGEIIGVIEPADSAFTGSSFDVDAV
jgi:hypothetical protein